MAVYERVDSTRKINILREYHRYSYDGSTIAKHIACVENLAQQCDTVGKTQSESNMLAKMLDDLPDRFSAVVTAWGVVPERDQTRITLKRMLLEAEARTVAVNETEQALAAVSEPTTKNTSKPKKDKKNKRDVECFKCHKKGHYARECRLSQPKKSADASTADTFEPSCFVIGEVENSERLWLADSGASCHMGNDRN